ncbi:MAG: nucleotidyltransferase family protein [Woeseiaceae bacterium]|nr:nucleotidyltransferase family protein [Woeseiaceae bacterium]
MRDPNSLFAVVLAAGTASRFGRQKLLVPFRGEPMVCKALRAAQHVAQSRTIVVTGYEHRAVESAAAGLFDIAVHNASFANGLGSSIAAGVRGCPACAEGVLLLLADQPLIDGPYLRKLVDGWCSSSADIVMSEYGDTLGPPAIFSKSTFDSLVTLSADEGARQIVNSGLYSVTTLGERIENPDFDTPEDLV